MIGYTLDRKRRRPSDQQDTGRKPYEPVRDVQRPDPYDRILDKVDERVRRDDLAKRHKEKSGQ